MPIATGAQSRIAYVKEVTFGTTPGTPTMKALRYVSSTLNPDKDTFTTDELRSDRQIASMNHGDQRPRGDIVGEWSYGTFDDLLEAGLFGAWTANVLKVGVLQTSYTIERGFLDIGKYLRFLGSMVNTIGIEIRPSRPVTITFGIIARETAAVASAQLGTPTAAPTADPFNSFTGTLNEGGTPIATVTALSLSLDNRLEPAFVLMGAGKARQVIAGRSNLTGRISAWFEDEVVLNKFMNETESSISVTLDGPAGDVTILVPRIKYTGGGVPTNGEGGLTVDLPFQALRDNTLATNLQITRVP